MARVTIRTYVPPAPPPVNAKLRPEERARALEEWAVKLHQWAQDTQSALTDAWKRAGLS